MPPTGGRKVTSFALAKGHTRLWIAPGCPLLSSEIIQIYGPSDKGKCMNTRKPHKTMARVEAFDRQSSETPQMSVYDKGLKEVFSLNEMGLNILN